MLGSANLGYANGKLQVVLPLGAAGDGVLTSRQRYDLGDGAVTAEQLVIDGDAAVSLEVGGVFNYDFDFEDWMGYRAGLYYNGAAAVISCFTNADDLLTQSPEVAYDPALHRHWRLTFVGGALQCETSNGSMWRPLGSPLPMPIGTGLLAVSLLASDRPFAVPGDFRLDLTVERLTISPR